MSMKDVLGKLPDYFIRCHKSYVANKYFIINHDKTALNVTVKTTPPTSIPIGYTYHKAFVKHL